MDIVQDDNSNEETDREDDSYFVDDEYAQDDVEEDANLFIKYVDSEVDDGHSGDEDGFNFDGLSSIGDLSSNDEDTEVTRTEGTRRPQKKLPKFKTFRKEVDLHNIQFHTGLTFANKYEVRQAVKEYGIQNGKKLRFVRNEAKRIRVICEGDYERASCPWVLYVAIDATMNTWIVKTYEGKHLCAREQYNMFASAYWLANKFLDDFRTNSKWKVNDFIEFVRRKYGIDITQAVVFKAKWLAKQKILGSVEGQYARLWDYCDELRRMNPGSTVLMKTRVDGDAVVFQRFYACFGACKTGLLEGCRPVLGLDGCHLKGPHKGQLLTAIGIDANNGMFPVAYAVVEVENRDSWGWFLQILVEDLGIDSGDGWVWITDKQKGLIQAIEEFTPNAEIRHYVRHLHNNFKTAGHGELGLNTRLWSCARASTIPWFNSEMEALKIESMKAYDWLSSKPAIHWSRSHFTSHSKCDMLLNNLCESFNAVILNARDKPILTMLELIRNYVMVKLVEKRSARWSQAVGPRIHNILDKNIAKSFDCIAHYAGDGKYQITSISGRLYVVDIQRHNCTCRRWELSGIPCPHAMSAIARKGEFPPHHYVHSYYKRATYDRSYSGSIAPMPGQEHWIVLNNAPRVKPPLFHKQPRRPKKLRKRELAEQLSIPDPKVTKMKRAFVKLSCGIYRERGHNARTCTRKGESSNSTTQPETQDVPSTFTASEPIATEPSIHEDFDQNDFEPNQPWAQYASSTAQYVASTNSLSPQGHNDFHGTLLGLLERLSSTAKPQGH